MLPSGLKTIQPRQELISSYGEKESMDQEQDRKEKMLGIGIQNSLKVRSDSMNILDDSADTLNDMLEELAKLPNVDNVKAACECAKQIQSLMRLKLDVIKLAKDLE